MEKIHGQHGQLLPQLVYLDITQVAVQVLLAAHELVVLAVAVTVDLTELAQQLVQPILVQAVVVTQAVHHATAEQAAQV
jgi:hypothetical protein